MKNFTIDDINSTVNSPFAYFEIDEHNMVFFNYSDSENNLYDRNFIIADHIDPIKTYSFNKWVKLLKNNIKHVESGEHTLEAYIKRTYNVQL